MLEVFDPNPWIAAVLSVAAPGLGHVYTGAVLRGASVLVLFPVGFLAAVVLLARWSNPPLNVIAAGGGLVLAYAGIVLDAWFAGQNEGAAVSLIPWLKWPLLVGVVALYRPAFRRWLRYVTENFIKPFRHVPGATAMQGSVYSGDYVLADLRAYKLRSPERGDVIVYRGGDGFDQIHRVAGVAGDVIEMRSKALVVNGTLDQEDLARYLEPLEDLVHPSFDWQERHVDDPTQKWDYVASRDNWGPLRVPAGSLFVLGDNRDASLDSRFSGFMEEASVVGRVRRIYFSVDPESRRVRWERLGQTVV